MSVNVQVRLRNAMLGLAMGDAISWSAMYHRSHLLPFWTRRLRREIDAEEETTGVTTQALPFSLNRDASVFLPGPTDDTEWSAFSARLWMTDQGAVTDEKIVAAWRDLAGANELVRGKASVMMALKNINKGLLPPVTGHDHPAFFDDAAMCRAVPIGLLFAGQPQVAFAAAERDACVTNAEDGIYAARAMAMACALACSGASVTDVVNTVLSTLPQSSWTAHTATILNDVQPGTGSLVSVVTELSERVVNREYNSGCVAAENLIMVLGIVKWTQGDFESSIMAANLAVKTADSLPALVGALTGALSDQPVITAYWEKRLAKLHGICIPQYKGLDYLKLIENMADMVAH